MDHGHVAPLAPTVPVLGGIALHFGFDESRAWIWITEKGRDQLLQFEAKKSFLERVRRIVKPQHGVTRDRNVSWRVDLDFPDRYAIPPAMVDELERAIKLDSGRILTDE